MRKSSESKKFILINATYLKRQYYYPSKVILINFQNLFKSSLLYYDPKWTSKMLTTTSDLNNKVKRKMNWTLHSLLTNLSNQHLTFSRFQKTDRCLQYHSLTLLTTLHSVFQIPRYQGCSHGLRRVSSHFE